MLIDFIGQLGPDAIGHASAPPLEGEVATKLARFSRGECSQAERVEVCEMLRLHPEWLRWIAERVKMARREPASSLARAASESSSPRG